MHKSRHSEDYICPWKHHKVSLRRRRLEVVGERENGRARGRHACLLLARPFFLVPTTSKHLLRRLPQSRQFIIIRYSSINNPTLHTLLINLAFSAKINWDCRPSKIDPIRCAATFGTSDMLSPKAFFFFNFKKEILLQHTVANEVSVFKRGWLSLTSCWLDEKQEFVCPY